MRTVSVVGIGAGNPEHVTVQAISTLNAADVVFMMDKGDGARELLDFRREICARYITSPSRRIVTAPDPGRPRGSEPVNRRSPFKSVPVIGENLCLTLACSTRTHSSKMATSKMATSGIHDLPAGSGADPIH